MIKNVVVTVLAAAMLLTSVPVTAQAATRHNTSAKATAGSSSGTASAVSGGSISGKGRSARPVTPSAITYAKPKFKKKSVSLYPGKTTRLKIRWTKGKKSKLTYSVKNRKIARVSKKGRLKALRPGKTRVTVRTRHDGSSTITIKVKKPNTKNTIYLTFDDGPGSKVTPKLLKVLKKHNVKATFFIVGSQAASNKKILKQIVKDGHTLAIHTYTHNYRTIYKSADAYLKDFHKTEKLIKDVTGVQPRYFRFPGGGNNHYMNKKIRNAVLKQLHKEGYTEMDWNASTGDAASNTYYSTATLVRNGYNSHWGRGPVVLLQHDTNAKYRTPEVTEQLIRHYKEKGCSFAGLNDYYDSELCFNYR